MYIVKMGTDTSQKTFAPQQTKIVCNGMQKWALIPLGNILPHKQAKVI